MPNTKQTHNTDAATEAQPVESAVNKQMTKDEIIESITNEIKQRDEVIERQKQQIGVLLNERAELTSRVAELSEALAASSDVLAKTSKECSDSALNDARAYNKSIRRNNI